MKVFLTPQSINQLLVTLRTSRREMFRAAELEDEDIKINERFERIVMKIQSSSPPSEFSDIRHNLGLICERLISPLKKARKLSRNDLVALIEESVDQLPERHKAQRDIFYETMAIALLPQFDDLLQEQQSTRGYRR